MPSSTLRIVVAGVLALHGVGHLMGAIPGLRLIRVRETSPPWLKRWSSRSWLLDRLLGDGPAALIGIVLFLAAFAGTLAAALGVMGWLVPSDAWRTLAAASAVVSLLAVALYWNALIFLFPHKVGAIGVDIAVLVGTLWLHWPSQAALGL